MSSRDNQTTIRICLHACAWLRLDIII